MPWLDSFQMEKLIQATGSILARNQGVIAKEFAMVAKSEKGTESVGPNDGEKSYCTKVYSQQS
jgi:hypothetical protein